MSCFSQAPPREDALVCGDDPHAKALALELANLKLEEFDLDLTGFNLDEIEELVAAKISKNQFKLGTLCGRPKATPEIWGNRDCRVGGKPGDFTT